MAEIVVAAENRTDTGKNENRRLRAQGKIPGILYGAHKETIAVAISPREITAILRSASGENTLFDLDLLGKKRKVILKEFQLEPLKGSLLHADFYEVALDKILQVKVHVEHHGNPIGVKVEGGILDFVTRELEVECLPRDIPEKIMLDVSGLALGKNLRVSDIEAPPKVKILTEGDIVVAHVVAPRAEEVPVAVEAVVAEGAVEPEVIKKGKTAEGEDVAEEKPEKPERPEKKEREKK
jgi:large subunit ribosomal protein L25